MTDWVDIDNTTIEPDAPLISSTMFALRDNPKAIAEGAPGAPRVVNAAITDGTIGAEKFQTGTAERDWVLARTAAANANAVGTYKAAHNISSGTVFENDTLSGSNLGAFDELENVTSNISPGGGNLPGTWRAMNRVRSPEDISQSSSKIYRAGNFLRIS